MYCLKVVIVQKLRLLILGQHVLITKQCTSIYSPAFTGHQRCALGVFWVCFGVWLECVLRMWLECVLRMWLACGWRVWLECVMMGFLFYQGIGGCVCKPSLPPPQVVLGLPYTMAIDMWSLGCMAAELFLGLPLFPGASEHDLLTRIIEALGHPPGHLLDKAKHRDKFFKVGCCFRVCVCVCGVCGIFGVCMCWWGVCMCVCVFVYNRYTHSNLLYLYTMIMVCVYVNLHGGVPILTRTPPNIPPLTPTSLQAHDVVVHTDGGQQHTQQQWQLRTAADFEAVSSQKASAGKRYFRQTLLEDIIMHYPGNSSTSGGGGGGNGKSSHTHTKHHSTNATATTTTQKTSTSGAHTNAHTTTSNNNKNNSTNAGSGDEGASVATTPGGVSAHEQDVHMRRCFVDFLRGVLDLDPATRWTPRQAILHPFITGQHFSQPFVPPPVCRVWCIGF